MGGNDSGGKERLVRPKVGLTISDAKIIKYICFSNLIYVAIEKLHA